MSQASAAAFDPWGPIEGVLRDNNDADLTSSAFSHAGLMLPPATGDAAYSHKTRNRFYLGAARGVYEALDEHRRQQLLVNIAAYLKERRPEWVTILDASLRRIGWMLVGDAIIPLELLDPHELASVPERARQDLIKAAARLATDPAGAITAACGAIDSVTADIYDRHGLGAVPISFEERVSTALRAVGVLDRLRTQLIDLGWEQRKAEELVERLRQAINHNSFIMATLRSRMGDAHGSKPTVDALVFSSVKWAAIISSIFTERDE